MQKILILDFGGQYISSSPAESGNVGYTVRSNLTP